MKKLLHSLNAPLLVLSIVLGINSFAQAQLISGSVTDSKNVALAGVSVAVKNTTNGTLTDASGRYSIQAKAGQTLKFSFIGKAAQEVLISSASEINVKLADDASSLEEVVVTGVFDQRTALGSSIAISSIGSKQIERLAPVSASDLLKNVPGVYVNSSLGEIRNTVYSRGVTSGKNDGGNYDYVSMQEDGLPVNNVPFGAFSPDMFLRADATISKVEAVRGGSASITGANAPGGIFNYISKTGGTTFEAEVRTRVGLEGNGKNPYYRADIDFGGPLNKAKNVTYNLGGFYRHADGAQYPGYASNYGGQIKGNLLYKYNSGSLKVLIKVLDDHNLTAEAIPTLNYTDMKPAPGFDNTSSVLPPAISVTSPLLDRGNLTYNPSDLWHSKYKSFGLNWEQNLGESGWKITNNFRLSTKSNEAFTPLSIVTPLAMDNIVSYFIIGALHPPTQIIPGTYTISAGGSPIMTVQSFSGFDYHVTSNTSPGSAIAPNSLFFSPLIYQNYKTNDFMNQFNLTKRTKNMTFNIGAFLSKADFNGIQGSQGVALSTIQNHPQVVDIKLTYGNPNPTDPKNGTVYQITNPNGVVNVGADQGYAVEKSKQTQTALFFGHTWEINNKLTLDWGTRYESVKIAGTNNTRALGDTGAGGLDGNNLTVYDNYKAILGAAFKYDKTLSYLSFSGALNYKISDKTAVYARFSNGKKSPGIDYYFTVSNTFAEQNLNPQVQNIRQFELGFKTKTEKLNISATPFYSQLAHIPSSVTFTDAKGALYNPPAFFNTIQTLGIEIDGLYNISNKFDIRGAVTLQNSKAKLYKSYIHLPTGSATSQTDSVVNNSGNKTAFVPDVMMNITPEFTTDKFYAGLTWSYMGGRQANFANAFTLPAFSQFNLSLAYNLSSKLRLSGNINNLFNNYGVLGWVGPGSFPNNLNLDGLTKQAIAKAPNAFHQSIAIPARAFFLSLSYKF